MTQATANEGIRSDRSMAAIPNENCNELCTILSHGESLVEKMMPVRASCCFYSITAFCLQTCLQICYFLYLYK